MGMNSDLLNQIEANGFRKDQTFQAGWSTGRMALISDITEAKSEDEMFQVLTKARAESRQIAIDGIRAILGEFGDAE